MRKCIITFRSITPAQRSEALLKQAGIACKLQRTPKWMAEKGCGYSLHLENKDVLAAISVMREAEISHQKVYVLTDRGIPEELKV